MEPSDVDEVACKHGTTQVYFVSFFVTLQLLIALRGIFEALIQSKLLYGLDTNHLRGAMLHKNAAFQIRYLRRILKI